MNENVPIAAPNFILSLVLHPDELFFIAGWFGFTSILTCSSLGADSVIYWTISG